MVKHIPSKSKIPAIPEKHGFVAKWEGLENAKLKDILFDMTFRAVYTGFSTVIQSEQIRENGLPLLLFEGSFTDSATISAANTNIAPTLTGKETLIESWEVTASEAGNTIRFLLPSGTDAAHINMYVSYASGP